MEDQYSIKIPVFEGPLDLLLHLIRENKMDIYDIPISLITRQYLDYIEMMKELDLDIAGEFLVMAATLIHIKSRMLLPVEDTADTEEEMDPRIELVERLLEYRAFKESSHWLREMEDEWAGVYARAGGGDNGAEDTEDTGGKEEPGAELFLFDINLFDLMGAFQKLIDRVPPETLAITRETLTVKDRIALIIDALEEKDALRFEDLFKDGFSRPHLIVTFVALLEVLRLGIARAYQEREFGNIWIINPERAAGFDPSAN